MSRWDLIDAHYHASPVPLLRMKAHRLANLTYAWAIERVAPDKLEEWERDMNDLLPWQDSDSETAEQIESESFFANYNNQQ